MSLKKYFLASGLLAVYLLPTTATAAVDSPELPGFIAEMVSKHQFDADQLATLFDQAELRPSIIAAITRPAEGKPWYQYRPIFVTEARIEGGLEFWAAHENDLLRAQQTYGVPAEIIVAIIGVETRYGGNTGSYPVLDALATLAFDYPARASFFRGELENYLLLTREENIDPLSLKGSYAGAMGFPQFIPSSYREYAVDFDGDGRRDLVNNVTDAIGSVANYFSAHGWQPGQVVAVPVQVDANTDYSELLNGGLKPQFSLQELKQKNVSITAELPDTELAALLEFEDESGVEYWVGLQNFYVITRYNHSPLYAMAVYQLSQELRAKHDAANQ